MRVEVRRSRWEEPEFLVFFVIDGRFKGVTGVDKVFVEGKEIKEKEVDFNDVYKAEIVEEEGMEETRYGYERKPALYIYLWREKVRG